VLQSSDRKLRYETCSSHICGTSADLKAKTKCLEVSQEHFVFAKDENNCKKNVIMGEKKQVYNYDVEIKNHS